jgi:PBSX family phage terminase large subunit
VPELVHHFVARGANLEALRSKAPRLLLAGPAGTGKTRVILEKLHQLCLRTPMVKCLVMRQTLVSLTASGVQTYEKDVAVEALVDGTVRFFGGSLREPPAFKYTNGSSIALGGLDKPMKVMSTEYDVIYVIEATEVTVEALDMLTTRLRNGRLNGWHQLIMDCNPDSPVHPLKLECDAGRMVMLHSRHEDNPRFFHEDGTMTDAGRDYMRTLDALTGVRYLRLRQGIWAAAEGVIYEEFNPAVHLVEPFEIPADWRRIWAVDFGYVNPFVWQDWAQTPDDQLILVREIYRTQMLVEDHAKRIRAMTEGMRPYAIVVDHDAEDRATLERHLGKPTRAANKTVSEGIQAMAARFRLDSRGRPRILFFKNATVMRDASLVEAKKPASTVEELPGYVWRDRKPGQLAIRADEPLKENDHGMDAARYLIAQVDLQPKSRMRWMG